MHTCTEETTPWTTPVSGGSHAIAPSVLESNAITHSQLPSSIKLSRSLAFLGLSIYRGWSRVRLVKVCLLEPWWGSPAILETKIPTSRNIGRALKHFVIGRQLWTEDLVLLPLDSNPWLASTLLRPRSTIVGWRQAPSRIRRSLSSFCYE